jgi:hypothetical protein
MQNNKNTWSTTTLSQSRDTSRTYGAPRRVLAKLSVCVGAVFGALAFTPLGASAANVSVAQNGTLNVMYARVDAVGKNTVTLTPVGGVKAEGIGVMIAGGQVVADSRELTGGSKTVLGSLTSGKVVSFSGYVTDETYTKKDLVQIGNVCVPNSVCTPIMKDVSSKVAKYTLRLTYLSAFGASSCQMSSRQGIDVPWSMKGTGFAVEMCRVSGVTWVYVPRDERYTVLEVRSGRAVLAVKPGTWVSNSASVSGGALSVTYDITKDGKGPITGKTLRISL